MKKFIFFSITIFLFLQITVFASNSISLEENWYYAIESNQKTITSFDMKPDDSQFKSIKISQLSNLQNLLQNKKGVIWLKNKFDVPVSFFQEDLSCYLGKISQNDQTWLNGVYIGGWGTFKKNNWDYWNKIRAYPIPGFLIHSGQNSLYIRIYVDNKGSFSSVPIIEKTHSIQQKVINENFISSLTYMLFAAILLLISLYHFAIYFKRKIEHINLTYAFITFISVLYLSRFFILELPNLQEPQISHLLYLKIFSYSLPLLLLYIVCTYLNELFNQPSVSILRIIRFLLLAIPLTLIFTSQDYAALYKKTILILLLTLPIFIYIFYISIISILHKKKYARFILSEIIFITLIFIFDILNFYFFNFTFILYILNWICIVVMISQFFILSARFAESRTIVEKLNTSLESTIHSKTRELTIEKDNFTNTSEILYELQKKQTHDLKIVTQIQKLFSKYPIPHLKEWDIAYCYKPINEVSGDIYDFFVKKDQLLGVELFNSSEHTVSSALIAMLIKNNITTCFYNGITMPLHTVMQKINQSISQNIVVTEKPITGILLRINGNHVEYVNAGHSDILHRSGKTGKVRPVKVGNNNLQGPAIGNNTANNNYKSVVFSMKPNDVLFMYSSSLITSKNETGEEFGESRIAKALFECTDATPGEKIKKIELELRSFCGIEPPAEDLTMLMIQKKRESN